MDDGGRSGVSRIVTSLDDTHDDPGKRRVLPDAPAMDPIPKRATLAELAYEHIKAAIIAGEVEPGKLYSVSQFSTLLEVSRTPVREALLALSADGLLTVHRNRGFQVLPITSSDVDDIVDIRRLLEVPAMERLASMDPQPQGAFRTARKLYAALQDAADEGKVRDFLALDRRFHLTLIDAAGNRRLVSIVAHLRDHMQLPGIRRLAASGSLHEAGHEHLLLLEALEAGNPQAAASIMHKHLDRAIAEWS